jgi:hypothetical protein
MATNTGKRKATDLPLEALLPRTAAASEAGHLILGGCDAVELAREFGTPLYVFDEADLRATCQEFLKEFRRRHAETSVVYAAKAYIGRASRWSASISTGTTSRPESCERRSRRASVA